MTRTDGSPHTPQQATYAAFVLAGLMLTACGNSRPDTTDDAGLDNAAGNAPVSATSVSAPPLAPSLWVLIDRGLTSADAEIVEAIARIDPTTGKEIDRLADVGTNPRELTHADGPLCVHNMGYDTVTCVDPATHQTVHSLEFDRSFMSYTYGLGSVWATAMGSGLVRVDLATGERTVLPANIVPKRLAFTKDALWIANTSMSVTRVDPKTNTVVTTIPTRVEDDPVMPLDIAAGGSGVWLTTQSGHILRIDPATNQISAVISGAALPSDTEVMMGAVTRVAADETGAWVVGLETGTVLRIDGGSNAAQVATTLEPPLRDITVGLGAVWVLHGENGIITRIEPASGTSTKIGEVGRGATGISAR
jgi:hypothetical protein